MMKPLEKDRLELLYYVVVEGLRIYLLSRIERCSPVERWQWSQRTEDGEMNELSLRIQITLLTTSSRFEVMLI